MGSPETAYMVWISENCLSTQTLEGSPRDRNNLRKKNDFSMTPHTALILQCCLASSLPDVCQRLVSIQTHVQWQVGNYNFKDMYFYLLHFGISFTFFPRPNPGPTVFATVFLRLEKLMHL